MGSSSTPIAVPAPRPVARRPEARPPRPSNVTLKVTMAVTGTVFALFVLVHMVGNLKVYTGAAHFDAYAHWLRTLAEPLLPYGGALWIFRVVLILCLAAHIGASLALIGRAHRAKGRFRRRGMGWRRLPATGMPVTGLVLLIFVVVHILDLTTGTKPVAAQGFESATEQTSPAYHNLVESLQRWPMALFYLAVMLLLGLHLVHGLWTLATDFGVTGRRTRRVWALAGMVFAAAVMLGNASIPIAVLAGGVG
ncbi:succinate dehydrogenase cytochrome b subunit [Gordonia sp. PP30]|uniref:succinate dehydrogenase cytochrome b subunit n=1 Tax=unclassified Gordonia (in: high G+C Gram-positive bacteria) TaxID=2657482 RepID=UPI001FFEF8A0|nr:MULTISPECIES: succinate dehydrogenase cytochrome b subunit [unclassified Gordonia (in: high G+C Gram-positive bacteria)]UQE74448.1 succinate dehydrogenase cytochrome b subunit [Gordonia sp. PP30]